MHEERNGQGTVTLNELPTSVEKERQHRDPRLWYGHELFINSLKCVKTRPKSFLLNNNYILFDVYEFHILNDTKLYICGYFSSGDSFITCIGSGGFQHSTEKH